MLRGLNMLTGLGKTLLPQRSALPSGTPLLHPEFCHPPSVWQDRLTLSEAGERLGLHISRQALQDAERLRDRGYCIFVLASS